MRLNWPVNQHGKCFLPSSQNSSAGPRQNEFKTFPCSQYLVVPKCDNILVNLVSLLSLQHSRHNQIHLFSSLRGFTSKHSKHQTNFTLLDDPISSRTVLCLIDRTRIEICSAYSVQTAKRCFVATAKVALPTRY